MKRVKSPGSVPEDITSPGSVLEDIMNPGSELLFQKISITSPGCVSKILQKKYQHQKRRSSRICYDPRMYPGDGLNPGDVLDAIRTLATGES